MVVLARQPLLGAGEECGGVLRRSSHVGGDCGAGTRHLVDNVVIQVSGVVDNVVIGLMMEDSPITTNLGEGGRDRGVFGRERRRRGCGGPEKITTGRRGRGEDPGIDVFHEQELNNSERLVEGVCRF